MDVKEFLKDLRVEFLNNGYEKKMSKVGVSPCSSAYAIEIALSCIKKIWGGELTTETLTNAILEKGYYEKMKSINVGKKNADYAMSLIVESAISLYSAS